MNQSAPATVAGSRAPTRLRRGFRLALIAAVLLAEFAALLWSFTLDDQNDRRRINVAQAAALSAALDQGADPIALRSVVDRAVGDLIADQAPGAAAIAAAARGGLDSTSGRARFAAAVQDSSERIDAQGARRDAVVAVCVFVLFTLICVGWFAWFNRLARRHRAVQHELTRREVQEAGERRLLALVHNSVDVIAVLEPDSTTSFVSPSVADVLGRDPGELVGTPFLDLVTEDDRPVLTRLLARTGGDEQELSVKVTHCDGRVLYVEGILKDLHDDPAVLGWVLTVRDVTARRVLEQDLVHQAFHDALTGLANRQLFTDRLEQALLRRDDTMAALSVLFVDLDDFKIVNDSIGHQVGDQILMVVADRIAGVLRARDTAARLGGDEFAVLLDGADEAEATEVVHRLLATFDEPVRVDGEDYHVRASVGLSGVGQGEPTDPHLMRNADVAMYDAKDRGKGGLAVYDDRVHIRALEQLQLRHELAEAIEAGQLVVYFQPTVSLQTQRVSGFEALVRWQHPERGLLPPVDFIPLAEQTGLVVALGEWVLRDACRAAAVMQRGGTGPSMAVNVAVRQLTHPDFHATVVDALAASGLPADRLVLEITETVLLDDVDSGVAVLNDLRRLGVRIAIDDFGTGYNSLAKLAVLPIDVLKVDKSFIDRLGGDDADSSLVDAILAMSTALGLTSVAEGVEHVDQARWLRDHHASLGQGYLWSRPVPLDQALDLLRHGVPSLDDAGPATRGVA